MLPLPALSEAQFGTTDPLILFGSPTYKPGPFCMICVCLYGNLGMSNYKNRAQTQPPLGQPHRVAEVPAHMAAHEGHVPVRSTADQNFAEADLFRHPLTITSLLRGRRTARLRETAARLRGCAGRARRRGARRPSIFRCADDGGPTKETPYEPPKVCYNSVSRRGRWWYDEREIAMNEAFVRRFRIRSLSLV